MEIVHTQALCLIDNGAYVVNQLQTRTHFSVLENHKSLQIRSQRVLDSIHV